MPIIALNWPPRAAASSRPDRIERIFRMSRPSQPDLFETPIAIDARLPLGPLTVRIPVAARMLGIGRSKFYELIASGDLEVVKLGGATLVPVDGLRALVVNLRKLS
jgi:excisionase family DNA binding protein